MKLKAVPQLRPAIALRSITDPLAVQWNSSVAPSIHNYEQLNSFQRKFLVCQQAKYCEVFDLSG
jgi:hypothetical protein